MIKSKILIKTNCINHFIRKKIYKIQLSKSSYLPSKWSLNICSFYNNINIKKKNHKLVASQPKLELIELSRAEQSMWIMVLKLTKVDS